MSDITSVGGIGAGLVGSGIAGVRVRAGLEVTVCEVEDPAATAGRARIEKSLDRGVATGKLTTLGRDRVVDCTSCIRRQAACRAVVRPSLVTAKNPVLSQLAAPRRPIA